eukprot:augustus_masked-scaffold_2-processed-gene-7.4-mRNA-1 protein AED:0.27 eAED:0.30 QI:0/-1/0/1/-1/1/1/0/270
MLDINALETIYLQFCNFGVHKNKKNRAVCDSNSYPETEIDATRLVKLARDCRILDKNLTRNDIDLIFNKVKSRAAKVGRYNKRKLNFDDFVECTKVWAQYKTMTHSELIFNLIKSKGKPRLSGTIPDAVSFHDDKNRYTGVHKNGGPEPAGATGPLMGLAGTLRNRKPSQDNPRPRSRHSVGRSLSEIVIEEKEVAEEKRENTCVEESERILSEGVDFIIHPDWIKVRNPRNSAEYDKFFYVNKVTNERIWSCPTVPVKPPDDQLTISSK